MLNRSRNLCLFCWRLKGNDVFRRVRCLQRRKRARNKYLRVQHIQYSAGQNIPTEMRCDSPFVRVSKQNDNLLFYKFYIISTCSYSISGLVFFNLIELGQQPAVLPGVMQGRLEAALSRICNVRRDPRQASRQLVI